ncbi:Uncharacterised protein [Halioglobus japonicus]|nr:Uncharacterised protein [Halioglobus japonicus]
MHCLVLDSAAFLRASALMIADWHQQFSPDFPAAISHLLSPPHRGQVAATFLESLIDLP